MACLVAYLSSGLPPSPAALLTVVVHSAIRLMVRHCDGLRSKNEFASFIVAWSRSSLSANNHLRSCPGCDPYVSSQDPAGQVSLRTAHYSAVIAEKRCKIENRGGRKNPKKIRTVYRDPQRRSGSKIG